jgi:hypothetical protein
MKRNTKQTKNNETNESLNIFVCFVIFRLFRVSHLFRDRLNIQTLMNDSSNHVESPLVDGLDYYMENGFMVFTAAYLLKRGYCCHHGCRHCPYGESTADDRQTTDSVAPPAISD